MSSERQSAADSVLARVRAPSSKITVNMTAGQTVFTDELKEEYVRLVSLTGVLGKCAEAVGVHPLTAIRHRKLDEAFRTAVDVALDLFRDQIDLAVYQRGVLGWDEEVYFNGRVVGVVRKYSDAMLSLFAKRHNAAYRERVEVNANVRQAAIVVTAPLATVQAMHEEAERIAKEAPDAPE